MKKKIFATALASVLSLSLVGFAGCGGNQGGSNNGGDPSGTGKPGGGLTANTVVRTCEDTREKAYVIYDEEGEATNDAFASLYAAISYCLDEYDTDSTIRRNGDIVFINDAGGLDTYYIYEDGYKLDDHFAWVETMWADLCNRSAIVVQGNVNGNLAMGGGPGYKLSGFGEGGFAKTVTSIPAWNMWPSMEAITIVDLPVYSGITQANYEVALKEAEIYPTYNTAKQKAYAIVGFMCADSNCVANIGLACNTNTGNWYYFQYDNNAGEVLEVDESEKNLVMTSTWNEAKGCYVPDHNIKLQVREAFYADEDGTLATSEDGEFEGVLLTVDLDDGTSYQWMFTDGQYSASGTLRFYSGLDVINDYELADYDCGAEFLNVKVTAAKGIMFVDAIEDFYVTTPAIGIPEEDTEYDLLIADGLTRGNFYSLSSAAPLSVPDYTKGTYDLYNHSLKIKKTRDNYTEDLQNAVDAIKALPETVTAETKAEAQDAYNSCLALCEALSESRRALLDETKLKALKTELTK